MDLACHYAGVAGAAEVAERQATHTGDVTRYVQDVCTRYDAFRGAISGLGDVYATAVGSACDGLDRGARAAQRWGGAARDTADDLADVDALARCVVERLADVFGGLPDDLLPVAPVRPDVEVGARLPSTAPGALLGPSGSPVPADDLLGLDTDASDVLESVESDSSASAGDGLDDDLDDGPEDGLEDELVDGARPLSDVRHLAEALGAGLDLADAVGEAAGSVDALGEAMTDGADAQDDAAAYDDFVAEVGA